GRGPALRRGLRVPVNIDAHAKTKRFRLVARGSCDLHQMASRRAHCLWGHQSHRVRRHGCDLAHGEVTGREAILRFDGIGILAPRRALFVGRPALPWASGPKGTPRVIFWASVTARRFFDTLTARSSSVTNW